MPTPVEVEWLQAFFGIEEDGYGPLTQAAVKRLQERHGIVVDDKRMIGPKTYRVLWDEHIDLIHQRWQKRAEYGASLELERLFASPMPPDLRAKLENLNSAYTAYWDAVEGRYKAILRRDDRLIIAGFDAQIADARVKGVTLGEIPALKAKYQPAIDALYKQAEKVVKDADDGDYAKLLAMLNAADHARWDAIAGAKATLGGWWDALWSADKSERRLGDNVASALQPFTTLAGVDSAQPGVTTTATVDESRTSDPAPTSPVPTIPQTAVPLLAAGDLEAELTKYFPKAADQLVIKHTISAEGPGKFSANWGGVVYRDKAGQLTCDRQWINFGLISFAYPSGSGGAVLKTLLSDPEEEKAFRLIAERLLLDNPGSEIKKDWHRLLNDPSNYTVAAKKKQEMIDEFVVAIKSSNGLANQDWMFKYLNTPVTREGVATGDMRDDWHSVLSEFLSRPSSQVTQLNTARNQYFGTAVKSALDPKQFGLTSIRGVGFMFDVTVQSGEPTAAMVSKATTEEYRQASEMQKLEMLRDTFRQGSTEWHRRDSVIKSKVLTDDPYPG